MKPETIGICLLELPEKDQAVIQRVITFAASQGKNYGVHPDPDNAHIIITLENVQLPTGPALSIRIGESVLPCDMVLQRPLLVTRVMRILDDAVHLLKSRPTITETPSSVSEKESTPLPQESDSTAPETESTEATNTAPIATTQPEEAPSINSEAEETISDPEPITQDATDAAIETTLTPDDYTYTALVVDDSASIRKQLELELRAAKIKAEFAETGEEALEKSAHKQYDLVFLDIVMPGIDGYEVCRQMRARKTMKKMPIIMLSGKTSPLDEVQGVIAGASTYLTKPVRHEQFQQTLKRVSKWLTNFAC